MATNKRVFTLRMSESNYSKIKIIAEKNKRSLAMQIEYVLEQYIAEYENKNGKLKDPDLGAQ